MKIATYVLWVLLGSAYLAFTADSDFTGNWKLDQEIALDNGKQFVIDGLNTDFALLITHTGNRFQVEKQCVACGKSVREYITDGILHNMPDHIGDVTYGAKWDGDALVINQNFEGTTPFGVMVSATKQVWSLSADKQILTVLSSSQRPTGTVTVTQIYKRQR